MNNPQLVGQRRRQLAGDERKGDAFQMLACIFGRCCIAVEAVDRESVDFDARAAQPLLVIAKACQLAAANGAPTGPQ